MSPIVGVHGIWNFKYYKDAGRSLPGAVEAISIEWARWLAPGLRGLNPTVPAPTSVPVAYYADCLNRGVQQGIEDPTTLPPLAQELLVLWVEEMRRHDHPGEPRPTSARHGILTWPVAQAANWLTRRFGDATRRLITRLVTELAVYFDPERPQRRRQARERVTAAVAQHQPQVLVAHSLGSIVAYEALCADPTQRVEHLITLGSPLAMPKVVFDRLDPTPLTRGIRPPGVSTWTNIADVGDPVAVPPKFLGKQFDGVTNDLQVSIHHTDPHTVKRYLSCATVAQKIAPYLRG